jgi:hypothetical protein
MGCKPGEDPARSSVFTTEQPAARVAGVGVGNVPLTRGVPPTLQGLFGAP